MATSGQPEEDFPKGHPGRADYNPHSPEAQEWARRNVSPLGERDWPVDHPAASDTLGNLNHITWSAGVDPFNAHREPFTGRTPEQAAGVALLSKTASAKAEESAALVPLDAAAINDALSAKRREIGRDVLTPEEYSEVIADYHRKHQTPEDVAATKAKIELQHRALAFLLSRGYIVSTAMEIIAREGADKILSAAGQPAQEG